MLTTAMSSKMIQVTSLLIEAESEPGFRFGVRALIDMKIYCVKCFLLKTVTSGKKIGSNVNLTCYICSSSTEPMSPFSFEQQ